MTPGPLQFSVGTNNINELPHVRWGEMSLHIEDISSDSRPEPTTPTSQNASGDMFSALTWERGLAGPIIHQFCLNLRSGVTPARVVDGGPLWGPPVGRPPMNN